MFKNITVYCGSGKGHNPAYINAAKELGEEIAKNKMNLVYGAGFTGMMGELAKSVLDNGGDVIGVVTNDLWKKEGLSGISNENQRLFSPSLMIPVIVGDFPHRRRILMAEADVICALPGSIGTIDEISEAIAMATFGGLKKPIIILNTNGYYDGFYKQLKISVDEGFASDKVLDVFKMVEHPHQIIPTAIKMMPQPNRTIITQEAIKKSYQKSKDE